MKTLRCKIIGGDHLLDQLVGTIVVVKQISDHVSLGGGYSTICVPEGEIPEPMKKWGLSELKIFSDMLVPLDMEIPEKLVGNEHMVQCWTFGEARNDAWFRQPPRDIPAWEKENEKVWKDIRSFDVEKYTL